MIRLTTAGSWPAVVFYFLHSPIVHLILKVQEIPYDHSDSSCMFQPSAEKPFVATPAAIAAHGQGIIHRCLCVLQNQAKKYDGLDYLQVFQSTDPDNEALWIIEDGPGGAITALLPSDY
jgi:hypothetical protein